MQRVAWLAGGLTLLFLALCALLLGWGTDDAEPEPPPSVEQAQPEVAAPEPGEDFVFANWDTADKPAAHRPRTARTAADAEEATRRKPARFEGVGIATAAPKER